MPCKEPITIKVAFRATKNSRRRSTIERAEECKAKIIPTKITSKPWDVSMLGLSSRTFQTPDDVLGTGRSSRNTSKKHCNDKSEKKHSKRNSRNYEPVYTIIGEYLVKSIPIVNSTPIIGHRSLRAQRDCLSVQKVLSLPSMKLEEPLQSSCERTRFHPTCCISS